MCKQYQKAPFTVHSDIDPQLQFMTARPELYPDDDVDTLQDLWDRAKAMWDQYLRLKHTPEEIRDKQAIPGGKFPPPQRYLPYDEDGKRCYTVEVG